MVDEERAAAAFGTLGDPTRIAVLHTFAEAMDEQSLSPAGGMPTLTFSELYDRLDVDSTSQLSYHLNELAGDYLRQVDDGWTITFAGNAIVRLVLSGGYAGGIDFEPVETDGRCPYCDAEGLRATVDDRALLYVCQACDRKVGGTPVTPAQVRDRDPESLLASTTTRTVEMVGQFRDGVCSECGGIADVDVVAPDVETTGEGAQYVATGRCRRCWWRVNAPPPMWLATHPASVSFHWGHGVDVTAEGARDIGANLESGRWRTDRVDTDPAVYEVTYRVDGDVLRLTAADDLSVRSAERVRRDPGVDR